jgi:hypothetical protein
MKALVSSIITRHLLWFPPVGLFKLPPSLLLLHEISYIFLSLLLLLVYLIIYIYIYIYNKVMIMKMTFSV